MTAATVAVVPAANWSFDSAQRRVVFDAKYPAGVKYSVRYAAIPEYVLRAETAKPLLRVGHDDAQPGAPEHVFPFNVQAVRLDRAIIQRQRGAVDLTEKSTFNNSSGKGPFR